MRWWLAIIWVLGFAALATVTGVAFGSLVIETWPASGFSEIFKAEFWRHGAWIPGSLLVGAVLGFLSARAGFLRTLEHELSHLLFALLFFQRPRKLVVTHDAGGEAAYTGEGNVVISLAPYFFPLYSVVFALLMLIASADFRPWFAGALLGGLSFHAAAVVIELFHGQSDVEQHGRLVSLSFVLALGFGLYGVLWGFAVEGVGGVEHMGDLTWRSAQWLGKAAQEQDYAGLASSVWKQIASVFTSLGEG
jgi:hypothetical protein